MRPAGGDNRDRDERSRDRDTSPAQGAALPTEWGGRTLRTERMIGELNKRVIELSESIASLQSRLSVEGNRLNAMESAIPERLHRTEERQSNHIELVNQLSSFMNAQLDTMNTRVNNLEARPPHRDPGAQATPGFGGPPREQATPGFGGPPRDPGAQAGFGRPDPVSRFDIGSPTPVTSSSPFAPTPAPSPAPTPNPFARTQQPQTSAVPDPWAAHAARAARPEHPTPPHNNPGANFNNREWSVSEKKVSKALTLFDGNAAHYRSWADRIKDHCKEVNMSYAYIFDMIEKEKQPIPMAALRRHETLPNGALVDMLWISNHLWVFIGRNVNDSIHGRRLTLTQNEPDNGIELWRALFVENEGGAEQVILGGMTSLHAFPQCPSLGDLQHWVGQWQITRQKFGQGLPEMHLRQMFLNMLPPAVAEKLRERKDISTLQEYINEINGDLGRLNDARLAKVNAQRMKTTLLHGAKNAVNVLVEEPLEQGFDEKPPNVQDEISKKLDGLIAVLTKQNSESRGRSAERRDGKRTDRTKSPRAGSPRSKGPDPRFKGCLHCGDEKHFRRDCPEFKALLAKSGDKLPQGYKGKYERWKDNQTKKGSERVATLQEASDEEFSETHELWAMPCLPARPTSSLRMPKKTETPVFNGFNALSSDADDDESEVLAALKQLTPNITVGPKVSQKRQRHRNQASTIDHVAHVARQVKNGEITLPDVRLEDNSEYEAFWALLDSGAGRSCAKKAKHFPKLKIENSPSTVMLSTANGHPLPSRGTFKLNAMTSEGNPIQPNFEDADVDMPIVAVSDISENGPAGFETRFRTDDGEIIDINTRKKSSFIRRRGVYFMKMFYKPNQCADDCECDANEPDFTRQGKP